MSNIRPYVFSEEIRGIPVSYSKIAYLDGPEIKTHWAVWVQLRFPENDSPMWCVINAVMFDSIQEARNAVWDCPPTDERDFSYLETFEKSTIRNGKYGRGLD